MSEFNSERSNDQKELGQEKLQQMCGKYEVDTAYLKNLFKDDDLVQFREFHAGKERQGKVCVVFCDGLTDADIVSNFLVRPLMETERFIQDEEMLLSDVVQVSSVNKTSNYNEVIQGILSGDTLLLSEGHKEALLFGTKSFDTRAITEPEGEKILSGPHEGFTEVLMNNLALVRRKLKTRKLKMKYYQLGEETATQLCISYLEELVNPKVVEELFARLDRIKIDGVLDANYINELIRDNPWSPFHSMGYTERPDVIAAKLLEGRVALFIDGTPVVLTIPYLFIENFQSNEDYYLNFYYTSFTRFLRILGFFLSILVPAVYIAIVAYHQEMLPSPLLISLAIERQTVPLPASLEAIIMLVVFEILRETALRMPTNVGQALSIVGALVLGQAAVEAKLVAAPMIIIVAMSGITSLLVPKMNAPVLLIRFGVIALASCLGFLGVTIGFSLVLIHILSLRSFGVWQMGREGTMSPPHFQDTLVRVPWHKMILRPKRIAGSHSVRQSGREGRK